MNDRDQMVAGYIERLQLLSEVLYTHDPYAMGSSIGAPEDEYAPIAEKLMPLLGKASGREEFARILGERGMENDDLVNAIHEIFHR